MTSALMSRSGFIGLPVESDNNIHYHAKVNDLFLDRVIGQLEP
jgi:hypothetical protein